MARNPHMLVWLAGAMLLGGCAGRAVAPVTNGGPSDLGLSVGTLVGRDARVMILATGHGTRYEVRTTDGELVGTGLTAEQVAQHFPGQDPRGAWAEEPPLKCGPLMLAEPRGFDPG